MSGTSVDVPYAFLNHYTQPSAYESTALPAGISVFTRSAGLPEHSSCVPTKDRRLLYGFRKLAEIDALAKAWQQLTEASKAPSNWNSYGAEAPNATAVSNSRSLLEALSLAGILPSFVHPSPEGGITMSFLSGTRHAAVEMHNDGDAVAVISSKPGDPAVWEFSPGSDEETEAISRLAAFILG